MVWDVMWLIGVQLYYEDMMMVSKKCKCSELKQWGVLSIWCPVHKKRVSRPPNKDAGEHSLIVSRRWQ
jgi:hypothetical protein